MRLCLRIPVAVLALCLMLVGTYPVLAQQACKRVSLTNELLQTWYNPKPDKSDVYLPLPGGTSLVFTPVSLSGSGLFLDERSVYKMGSQQNTHAFETPLEVRVGSAIANANKRAELLIGKYEFTKGQYAMVMGTGGIVQGVNELRRRSHDPRIDQIMGDYFNKHSPCYQVMTQEIANFLAEPLTFLSYGDYIDVIDRINLYCIQTPQCRTVLTSLGRNPDFPGFVRLPTEHEWEFVARGGRDFVEGRITREALQADVPYMETGETLATYAHLDSDPPHLQPIGSRKEWFGFYDMLGNAQELMENPFSAENGFGAVGGYVARGGDFRLHAGEMRVSKRVELSLFRYDDQRDTYELQYFPNTGMRMELGLPVTAYLERTGDAFGALAQSWVPIDEAGDIAGNTIADAKNLGTIGADPISASDEVSSADGVDYYAVTLNSYAKLKLEVENGRTILATLSDADGTVVLKKQLEPSKAARDQTTEGLMPGRYYLRFDDVRPETSDNRYSLKLTRVLVPDTGIAHADTASLAKAELVYAAGTTHSGFVGAGDKSDIYPVTMGASLGGMEVVAKGLAGGVTLSYLDSRQQVVETRTSGANSDSLDLRAGTELGQRGFVQITAARGTSTLYRLEMRAKALYDRVFAKNRADASRTLVSDHNYEGYLSKGTPRLYATFYLLQPKKVRIELTGLQSNVDLSVFDDEGQRLKTDNHRSGSAPEFIEKNLASGRYYVQLALQDYDSTSPFAIHYSTSDVAVSASMKPAVARSQAEVLYYGGSNTAYVNASNKGYMQYFYFDSPAQKSVITIDIGGFTADSDLDVFLEDSSGNVIQKSTNSGDMSEFIKIQSEGTKTYYLRVQPAGTVSRAYFHVALVVATEMRDPSLSWMGPLVETSNDWEIHRSGDRCYMATTAKTVTPDLGWLNERPTFYIGVDKGSSSVYFSMQYAEKSGGTDLYRNGNIRGFVTNSRGSRSEFPVEFEGQFAKPLSSCSAGTCIDSGAVRKFRRGRMAILTGNAPDGTPTRVEYSLSGYTHATSRINQICHAKAYWVGGG